jgi:WD40 repeat protein
MGPKGGVLRVAFSPDGRLLATAGLDGNVRLWDSVTRQPVGSPIPANPAGGNVSGVTFSAVGSLLATADSDGTVRLWDMALFANPYTALCVAIGPPTRAEWDQNAPEEPFPKVCA